VPVPLSRRALGGYGGVVVHVQPCQRQHVAGAASVSVLGSVSGPPRSVAVLHAGQDAVYLDLDGACLGVLSSRAVLVPCGVRTHRPRLPALHPGDGATVGGGSIELPGLEVTVTQTVDTTVGVLSADDIASGAHLLRRAVGDRLAGALAELPEDPMRRLAACDPAAVAGLLGFGGGLTPLGDDVLAGWLAAGVATRHPALGALRSGVVRSARQRTTTLSATLLECAARGEGVPQFGNLLRAMATGDPAPVERAVDDLLDIGGTSGSGLVLGALVSVESRQRLSPSPQGASR